MSPRWLTIEKLVTELGGVCNDRDEVKDRVGQEPPEVEESVCAATRAVTAAVASPMPPAADSSQPDEIVRSAWTAIAVAQDRVAKLKTAVARSEALRNRAQGLQDQSLRLRHRIRPPSD
jgi:hypothetical protein